MQTAKIALAEELGPASQLVALIEGGKFVEALELNAEIAGEMPFARLVERWFVEKIEAVWPDGAAAKAWANARAPGKERLKNLSARLEEAKRKIDEARREAANHAAEEEAQPKPEEPKPAARPWPEAPIAPPDAVGFERLTYPRGLVGHLVQHIYASAALPDRVMALAGALAACAKGLDRKVLGPTGNSTILFLLLIGESGSGKQHILNCIRRILRAMDREQVLAASGIASVQSVEQCLEGMKGNEGSPSLRSDSHR